MGTKELPNRMGVMVVREDRPEREGSQFELRVLPHTFTDEYGFRIDAPGTTMRVEGHFFEDETGARMIGEIVLEALRKQLG